MDGEVRILLDRPSPPISQMRPIRSLAPLVIRMPLWSGLTIETITTRRYTPAPATCLRGLDFKRTHLGLKLSLKQTRPHGRVLCGGEDRIRTCDRGFRPGNRLAGGPIRPLWHLPNFSCSSDFSRLFFGRLTHRALRR